MKYTNKLKNIYWLLTIVLVLAACKKEEDYLSRTSYFKNIVPPTEHTDSLITCLTWNIQLGFPSQEDPWNPETMGGSKEHMELIASIIETANPDIIALQEIPLKRENTIIKYYIDSLAKRLNMNYAFGSHGFNSPGYYPTRAEWGNAVLSKLPIVEIENQEVSFIDVWERRSVLNTEIRLNFDENISVYSLHHIPTETEIPATIEYLKKSDKPKFLMGDFNHSEGTLAIYNFGLEDALAIDNNFEWDVDRILYSADRFEIQEVGAANLSLGVSDHPANYAVFKVK